jgi:prevent-host-death family protein
MKPAPRVQEVGAYEAKTHLSRLLRQTRAGKSFIITQRGKPVAELKPAPVKRGQGHWGDMKGKIRVADDFCEPIEDMKEYME